MSATTTNTRLQQWVDEWAAILQPERIYWCDGSAEEYDRLCQELVDAAPSPSSTRPSAPTATGRTPIRATSPASRTAPSSAAPRGRRRPEQQLARPGRDARRDEALYTGAMKGRTMYVVPFSMGPLGSPIAHIGVQLTDSRLRRRQHADHDPHGPGRPRRARRRPVGAVRALGRRAARAGPGRRRVAVQPRQQVHRPLPRDPRDHELRLGLRRQRPARQEVLRAAHRLGDGPRRRLAGRAHAHPQAHQPRRASTSTSPPRSRRPAARPTSRCSCRPSRAGRPRRSATTSAG
jgi:hypothetical protein